MTALPQVIQVGPTRYTVKSDEMAALTAKNQEKNANCVGSCNHSAQEILIDPNQGPDQTADTVLHEVLHAVFAAVGAHEGPLGRYEEQIVAALSTTLLDTLRRNPDLVAYLTAT